MNPIPYKLKKEIKNDNWYKKCCITGITTNIELHHCFLYGKKQINEKFNIIPLTSEIHDEATPHKDIYISKMRRKCEWIAINRSDIMELYIKYPKKEWNFIQAKLNNEFGDYNKYEYRDKK